MSQPASFIPPDVQPPDPPGTKTIAFIFSGTMALLMLALIGFVCIDFFMDFANIPMPYDTAQQKTIQEECGPFISDFLGLNFEGQYVPKYGKNARSDRYHLTDEDRKSAIQQLQQVIHDSKEVSVDIISFNDEMQRISEQFWLSYDREVADDLSTQVNFTEETFISILDFKYVPDVVYTFYPSDIKINIMANPPEPSAHSPFVYISWGVGMQRWEGFFGTSFIKTLLNARLKTGETVQTHISERLPVFP